MATSSSRQKLPAWLASAIGSKKHIAKGVHILAQRESTRVYARTRRGQYDDEDEPGDPAAEHYSTGVGMHHLHLHKNRYMDILPYDRTRVIVNHESDKYDAYTIEGRYLNANWVLERFGHKWWIAAQAPLKHTAHAFMSLILQPFVHPPHSSSTTRTSQIRTVVQLTRNVELGRKKADVYFPSEIGQSLILSPEEGCRAPPLKATLLQKRAIERAHCIHSTVSITPLQQTFSSNTTIDNQGDIVAPNSEPVIFEHLLYLSWPDHGVPDLEHRDSLLTFINLVDSINRDKSHCSLHPGSTSDHPCTELDPDPPVIIGCSAGIGRTGSFIAISSLLRKYGCLPTASNPSMPSAIHPSPLGPLPNDFKDDLVLLEIDSLREQRPGMVQKNEQALLIYEVLVDSFTAPSS
ncbi:phosphatases II [Pholiota conissans]|uniref:Phosphatases II n=1 Tax=Pholiota conissans TaxID=109636 RepID=A0A9P6D772_9AGAR|nr:phosphatases II [Pholiota conissans]